MLSLGTDLADAIAADDAVLGYFAGIGIPDENDVIVWQNVSDADGAVTLGGVSYSDANVIVAVSHAGSRLIAGGRSTATVLTVADEGRALHLAMTAAGVPRCGLRMFAGFLTAAGWVGPLSLFSGRSEAIEWGWTEEDGGLLRIVSDRGPLGAPGASRPLLLTDADQKKRLATDDALSGVAATAIVKGRWA